MTQFPRSIADFVALPGWRALRWLPVLAAFATMAAPPSADAATRRRAAGAYDGIWNVVFATTRGNCSSGYSVPFTVTGSRVLGYGVDDQFNLVESLVPLTIPVGEETVAQATETAYFSGTLTPTAAAHATYEVIEEGNIGARWSRCGGW
jgi:hypothetical protein